MHFMIVMLIWVGGGYGGPATIQGFSTMKACEDAIPKVTHFYNSPFFPNAKEACIKLKRK